MSPRRPSFDTLISLRATLQKLETEDPSADYASLKRRLINRIAELELRQALAEQASTNTPPAPMASMASQDSAINGLRKKLPTES
jgi:hypothetical protein